MNNRLLLIVLGLIMLLGSPGTKAAENLVLVFGEKLGFFRKSIAVSDLHHLARSGEARDVLGTAIAYTGLQPQDLQDLLAADVHIPLLLGHRLLHTRVGEAVLNKASSIVYPLRAPQAGSQAFRAGAILGMRLQPDGRHSITLLDFLDAYPSRELAVHIPRLLATLERIGELTGVVRYFADEPLQELREPGTGGG